MEPHESCLNIRSPTLLLAGRRIKKFPIWWLFYFPACHRTETQRLPVEMQHLRFNRCSHLGVRAGFRKKKFHGVGSSPARKRGLSMQTRYLGPRTHIGVNSHFRSVSRPRLFLIMSDPGSSRASNVASRWNCCWSVVAGCHGCCCLTKSSTLLCMGRSMLQGVLVSYGSDHGRHGCSAARIAKSPDTRDPPSWMCGGGHIRPVSRCPCCSSPCPNSMLLPPSASPGQSGFE